MNSHVHHILNETPQMLKKKRRSRVRVHCRSVYVSLLNIQWNTVLFYADLILASSGIRLVLRFRLELWEWINIWEKVEDETEIRIGSRHAASSQVIINHYVYVWSILSLSLSRRSWCSKAADRVKSKEKKRKKLNVGQRQCQAIKKTKQHSFVLSLELLRTMYRTCHIM